MKRRSLLVWIVGTALVAAAVIVSFGILNQPVHAPTRVVNDNDRNVDPYQNGTTNVFTEVRTQTFESSTPQNNAILVASPGLVTVRFSEAVQPASSITIYDRDNQASQLGRASFSEDRKSMSVLLRTGVAGPVRVSYQACRLDTTCSVGSFGFVIRPTGV